jgi:hypothetical protein
MQLCTIRRKVRVNKICTTTKKVAVLATLPKEAFWQANVRGGAIDTR